MRVCIFGSLGTAVTYSTTILGVLCACSIKKEMRRFHSNAGSFGQPRCDKESPRVLLGTVLFVFLEALKLSPQHCPLPPSQRRPNGARLPAWWFSLVILKGAQSLHYKPWQTWTRWGSSFPWIQIETKLCKEGLVTMAGSTDRVNLRLAEPWWSWAGAQESQFSCQLRQQLSATSKCMKALFWSSHCLWAWQALLLLSLAHWHN